MIRPSMRPVSFKRIIEMCSMAQKEGVLSEETVSQRLNMGERRAREILRELISMNLLTRTEDNYTANENTLKILDAFKEGDWVRINQLFMENNFFYENLVMHLRIHEKSRGYTIEELTQMLKDNELHFNKASVEVLLRWGERFGITQRNLYRNVFYTIKKEKTNLEEFKKSLIRNYDNLDKKMGLFLTQTYVEIPRLREEVCEELKIDRITFDTMFFECYRKLIGKIELAGAPTITSAKKSPLSIKKTRIGFDNGIISPIYDLEKERRGIEIMGKNYYFIAIH